MVLVCQIGPLVFFKFQFNPDFCNIDVMWSFSLNFLKRIKKKSTKLKWLIMMICFIDVINIIIVPILTKIHCSKNPDKWVTQNSKEKKENVNRKCLATQRQCQAQEAVNAWQQNASTRCHNSSPPGRTWTPSGGTCRVCALFDY